MSRPDSCQSSCRQAGSVMTVELGAREQASFCAPKRHGRPVCRGPRSPPCRSPGLQADGKREPAEARPYDASPLHRKASPKTASGRPAPARLVIAALTGTLVACRQGCAMVGGGRAAGVEPFYQRFGQAIRAFDMRYRSRGSGRAKSIRVSTPQKLPCRQCARAPVIACLGESRTRKIFQ